jgi:hypothetical protein
MASFLLTYFIVICCSIFLNNLNDKRQYPTYWGIGSVWDYSVAMFGKTDDEKKKEAEGKLA